VTVMPRDHEWTVADLANTPDDGLRYELDDGVLLVSAAPSNAHQIVLGELYVLLRAACPADARVMLAPTDYQPTKRRSLQPDVLVVRRADVGAEAITAPLLLAVEVLSPSTRSVDLLLKRGLYAESGVASYWVVDPLEPSIQAWDLVDGDYVDAGRAEGDELLTLTHPFPIEVRPRTLLD
jgi:Uma2 family endonuclease